MKCPACGNELSELKLGSFSVDVCDGGCGGVFFDQLEIKKVDEPHETLGQKILAVKKNPKVVVDHSKRRICPNCGDIIMMRHFFSIKRDVEIDECPACAGIWLDAGELEAIRTGFSSELEKQKAAEAMFNAQFDDQLKVIRAETEEQSRKSKGLAHKLRFILPSFWLPGKQNGGAF